MNKKLLSLGTILFLYAPATAVAAAPVSLLHYYETYRVQIDGRYTVDTDVLKRLETSDGVRDEAQKQISYSSSMESVQIVDAYTETERGEKIHVDERNILTQESAASANAPIFSDLKTKVIVFPRAEIGSKLRYRYLRIRKTPLFSGQFSTVATIPLDWPTIDAKLAVIAPKELKIFSQTRDYTGGPTACAPKDKGMQCFVWAASNSSIQLPEPLSVSSSDFSPFVAISTFKDYAALASAYATRAHPQSAVTDKVKTLADALTHGVQDEAKQIEVLYNWVSENIRYVGIYLGAGSVVPHSANDIIDNRYGDCKDHVVLLEALLAAKGIRSTGALINLGNSYWLPDVVVAPGVFNHIITYIPSQQRYVDSTLQFARYGQLSIDELGKHVLDIDPTPGKQQLDIIPLPRQTANETWTNVVMSLHADGTIEGSAKIREMGVNEISTRRYLTSIPDGQNGMAAQSLLSMTAQNGIGAFDIGEPRDLSKPYEYRTSFTLVDYVHFPGPGAFTLPTGLHSLNAIDRLAMVTTATYRTTPMTGCVNSVKHEDYQLEMPQELKVLAIPKNVQINRSIGSYRSVYEYDGVNRRMHVTREFVLSTESATCSPAQYNELRAFALEINKDLRAQVLYE